MKKNSLVLLTALMLGSTAVVAEEAKSDGYEVSGYLTGTNNFMYRGVSLSSNHAAIQGEVKLTLDSGIYTSLWGSNTQLGAGSYFDFGGPGLEGNFRLGYSKNINEDLSFDVGYLRTFYPGVDVPSGNRNPAIGAPGKFDFNDFYGSLTYKAFSAGLSYSNDFFGRTGKAYYTYASYNAPIIDKLSLKALVGHTRNSSNEFLGLFLGGQGASNWTHYVIGLSHPLPKDIEISGEWHGVDSNGNEAFKLKGFGANRFVFNLTKNF
jgi:uncharacterized protein (TIGR02001 family)